MSCARPATADDVSDIARICSAGYRATYPGLLRAETIEDVVLRYYQPDRIAGEIAADPPGWLGYVVSEGTDGRVMTAGGGGMTADHVGEVFVLYADPHGRGRGHGSRVLEFVSAQHVALGATEQWVSVAKGNELGIPFYFARGFIVMDEVESWDGTGAEEGLPSLRMRRPLPWLVGRPAPTAAR